LADALGSTERTLALTPRPLVGELEELAPKVASVLAGSHTVVAQRIHGDLHVAQFLRSPERIAIVDWQGQPGRPPPERPAPLPPARDLGSLRLSLAHAARAAHRRNPAFDWRSWSTDARAEALAAYEAVAGPVDRRLLHTLEVAKELDELEYATRYVPE